MSKVSLNGFIEVQESDLEAVISALPLHVKLTLDEVGCNIFEVIQRTNNPCVFDVYEEFIDKRTYDLHQSRIKGTEWASVTQNIVRHYEMTKLSGSSD